MSSIFHIVTARGAATGTGAKTAATVAVIAATRRLVGTLAGTYHPGARLVSTLMLAQFVVAS